MDPRKDHDALLKVLRSAFQLEGDLQLIYGDQDLNYKLRTSDSTYLVKVCSNSKHQRQLQVIDPLLEQLQNQKLQVSIPKIRTTSAGELFAVIGIKGDTSYVRVYDWIEGRLWADVQPKTSTLRRRLGQEAGRLQSAIRKYSAPPKEQQMRWDLAQSTWTEAHAYDFEPQRAEWVRYFQDLFREAQPLYQGLKKCWIHNDLNDYNILLTQDPIHPGIAGFIDFGDCCFTQGINELAILLTYAIIEAPEPLGAAVEVIEGYHAYCPLEERELEVLYSLVGMRLVTSVCVSHLRKQEQPDDPYLTISEAPAWALMEKWFDIPPDLAHFTFRKACGLKPHPQEHAFHDWAKKQELSINDLFPAHQDKDKVYLLDLKPSSTWIGGIHDFNDLDRFTFAIDRLQAQHPDCFIAGGYLEPRPLYTSTSYDRPGNNGPESRTVHLGMDVWLPAGTPVHAPFDGEIFTRTNDAGYKEYGGLIILKHYEEGIEFYTLYGHLSADSPARFDLGEKIKKGQQLGALGDQQENGVWSPHLHFQVMLHMLDYIVDFPGVAYKSELEIWKSICPDPNLWFRQKELHTRYDQEPELLMSQRRDTLGPNLSLSYERPLHIVRGQGAYLMDSWGRQFLDTVNNVAHVGHEHPRVVAAGQAQMAVLNTNTRYLHKKIIDYADELRNTLPKKLEVIYLVNSGSEANELALRMVRAATGSPHMLAIEMGYHGNTNAVIDVSSYKFDRKGGGGAPGHTHLLPVPDAFRGKHRENDVAEAYSAYSREQIAALERQGHTLGGLIHESILSCAGQIDPPEGYLQQVYEEVRNAGGICVADEVQTGFGRVGSHFWAFQRAGILPDIVTMGKPAGNGHPLGILACTREVAEAFANGMEFFNTFGGNPVSCAIGMEVLRVIKDEELQANALSTGEFLKHGLREMATDFPIISDVRGSGLFLGVELTDGDLNPMTEKTHYLVNRMRDFGILTSSDGPHENVIKIKPPMVFGREQAETLLQRLRQILTEDYMKID